MSTDSAGRLAEQLDRLTTCRREMNARAVPLALRAIAELLHQHVPDAEYLELDWSDQPGEHHLVPQRVRTPRGDFPTEEIVLERNGNAETFTNLRDDLNELAAWLDESTKPLWGDRLMPYGDPGEGWTGFTPPCPPPYIRLYVQPALAEMTWNDYEEITYRDAKVSWYPRDEQPAADPFGMPSDMYVFDAHGVSVLIRRRSASTYIHIDSIETETGPALSPLEVEVNNGGESEHPVDGVTCPTCGSTEWDLYRPENARCVNWHTFAPAPTGADA